MNNSRNRNRQRLLRHAVLFIALLTGAPVAFAQWRDLDPQRTVFMDIAGERVVIELNPLFAPITTRKFAERVREGFYDGLSFYRVIDGFVAQGGDGSDLDPQSAEHPTLPAEFERPSSKGLDFVRVQSPDLFAAETGFVDGFAAARESEHGATWLVHCPGVVAMARGNDPQSGMGDFYIVTGQAPRYLDRNLTIFGRVVAGMATVQKIRRGPGDANGVIENAAERTRIDAMKLASEVPAGKRRLPQVIDTGSETFARTLDERRHRKHPFFHHTPPPVLDVCQVPLAVRQAPQRDEG